MTHGLAIRRASAIVLERKPLCKFDRTAYQREYMRKWRARRRAVK